MRPPPAGGGAVVDNENVVQQFVCTAPLSPRQVSDCPPPWRCVGAVAAGLVADIRRQRLAAHLHSLGPRAVYEALLQVALGDSVDHVLADFARLTPDAMALTGGDKFPPPPLYRVRP